jgi:hypothetical protein
MHRPRCRWKDNTNTNLEGKACEITEWLHLAQDHVQWRGFFNTEMSLSVPYKAENFFEKMNDY